MGAFYVTDGPYLASMGACPDGMEQQQALPGQLAHAGTPPGFAYDVTPFNGARWHVAQGCWVDARSAAEQEAGARFALMSARYGAYPPITDLADALYWQSQGDNDKMDAYLAACAAVKLRFPKPD